MKIQLTAKRTSRNNADVSITFSDIINDGYSLKSARRVENSKGEEGVVFHFNNIGKNEIHRTGTDTLLLNANLEFKTKKIRVMYWNDESSLNSNLNCFIDFMETHGLKDSAPDDITCLESNHIKSVNIPRQAGNGGVVRIVDIP